MALNIKIVLCFLAVYINVEMAFYFTIIRDTFIPSNLIYFIVDILYCIFSVHATWGVTDAEIYY